MRGRAAKRIPAAAWGAGAVLAGAAAVAALAGEPPAGAAPAAAGRGFGDATPGGAPALSPAAPVQAERNVPYDGRFTFVRVSFEVGGGDMRGFGWRRSREPAWAHDYPRAEVNFLKILDETTLVDPSPGHNILSLEDDRLFQYPVAYIVEVGYWNPSDEAAANLREWLAKGGFLIVDDFRGSRELDHFVAQLERVVPGVRLQEVEPGHDIFDSFFHIDDPYDLAPPTFRQFTPLYLGAFEDNDPSKRLMVMVNANQDIAEYWEFSDRGYYPIDLSNEAYKFGVNYIVYAMTH